MDPENESGACNFEQTILSITECFVYKVPALRSASGHRAEDWSLDAPLFTGSLRMYQSDLKMRIALFTYSDPKTLSMVAENLTLFGECCISVKPGGDIMNFVDGVIDSSRYYVLRLQDRTSTRSALMGIGFRERDTAFDFKNALNDYVRYVDRVATADKAKTVRDEINQQVSSGKTAESTSKDPARDSVVASLSEHRDLSIPHGQKIKIKSKLLKSVESSDLTTRPAPSIQSAPSQFLKKHQLAPPPQSNSCIDPSVISVAVPSQDIDVTDEEEWGDFGSAAAPIKSIPSPF